MRLFCFPHAGAGPSQFRAWRTAPFDIVPITLPGRDGRFAEPPLRRLDTLLDDVLQSMQAALHTHAPFALIGHSMGALVAFETVRELRRRRWPLPQRLFVSAFRAPHLPDPAPAVHALPDRLLKAELLRLDGTPAEILRCPELLDTLLPTLRADMQIVEQYRYRPEPSLPCPITCFGGLTDRRIGRAELPEWRRHTAAEFRLRLFPGGHFYLYQTPLLVQRAICADLGLPVLTAAAATPCGARA